ncbi:MAG: toxin-antitoxin system YwqK family antitoxin [Deltaproteobacteria bacterium]|nr:toxin-antitoxin system YwqK family antitoxin [Deltaproteobacteria bacterium]
MKKITTVLLMILLVGCQSSTSTKKPVANPVDGQPATPDPAAPDPKDENRTACPDGTGLKGGPPPGSLEEWCEKPNGSLHGRSTIWHSNSFKAAEGEYLNNQKTGSWTYWHSNGKRASGGDYKEGKRHGAWTFWHENEQKAEAGNYQAGVEEGVWQRWNEAGEKSSEQEYKNGMPIRK